VGFLEDEKIREEEYVDYLGTLNAGSINNAQVDRCALSGYNYTKM
jgi:hypothetical protein